MQIRKDPGRHSDGDAIHGNCDVVQVRITPNEFRDICGKVHQADHGEEKEKPAAVKKPFHATVTAVSM
jgi:hypothetical protein